MTDENWRIGMLCGWDEAKIKAYGKKKKRK